MSNLSENIIVNLKNKAMQNHCFHGDGGVHYALGALAYLAQQASIGDQWAINKLLELSKPPQVTALEGVQP